MINGDIISLAEIIIGFTGFAVSLMAIYLASRTKRQLEAVQAKLVPTVAFELKTEVKEIENKRILLLDLGIRNLGEVIATLVVFELLLSPYQFGGLKSKVLFGGKERIYFNIRKKILHNSEDLPDVKYSPELENKPLICWENRGVVERFDGECAFPFPHEKGDHWDQIKDEILGYDYLVGECKHFIFPFEITGQGFYKVSVWAQFIRHKIMDGKRILDIKGDDLDEVPQKWRDIDPSIHPHEKWLGRKVRSGYSECWINFLPEEPSVKK